MTIQEIKTEIENGQQYGNDVAGWFTVNRPNENCRMIYINDEFRSYKNLNSYAKRILQLINRGH